MLRSGYCCCLPAVAAARAPFCSAGSRHRLQLCQLLPTSPRLLFHLASHSQLPHALCQQDRNFGIFCAVPPSPPRSHISVGTQRCTAFPFPHEQLFLLPAPHKVNSSLSKAFLNPHWATPPKNTSARRPCWDLAAQLRWERGEVPGCSPTALSVTFQPHRAPCVFQHIHQP